MMKLVMFKGGVETQEFFSIELSKSFQKLGYHIFFYDLLDEQQSFIGLQSFYEIGNTVMFTFNFNGIAGEDYLYYEDGSNFWDDNQIPCFNMVLDHPFYYHKYLKIVPKRYYQISIDRFHETYMKRYFPEIGLAGFLPLGGTHLETGEPVILIKDRPIDIVFTGNYTRPETFYKYISHLDKEYIDFYYGILDELIANPELRLEEIAEVRIKEQLGDISDQDLKGCYENMIFIDLSARFYYRARVVKELVDSGFKVNIYGAGWDVLSCKHPENIIMGNGVNSLRCLEMICQSKISLNVMPWFKDGAHDRIFNSMLNGAVSFTDDSIYLKDEFLDGQNLKFYHLKNIEQVPEFAYQMLNNPDWMQNMADCGSFKAENEHTWENRANDIDNMIKSYFKFRG